MAPATAPAFVSKTQHYLKVKKPLLERQRRARINKCLDSLKTLVAEFQNDDAILRMDKAEMLETAIDFIRQLSEQGALNTATTTSSSSATTATSSAVPAMDGFRNGYMNAVNEVSRVMAGMPGMSIETGKSVMTHLGFEFNRMLRYDAATTTTIGKSLNVQQTSSTKAPLSPASSGYHSDSDDNSMASPCLKKSAQSVVWRPW